MGREIVRQETLLLWLGLCVAVGLPLMLIDSLVVWLLHGCWPLRGYADCFARVPRFEWHLLSVVVPTLVGATAVTWWLRRRERSTDNKE